MIAKGTKSNKTTPSASPAVSDMAAPTDLVSDAGCALSEFTACAFKIQLSCYCGDHQGTVKGIAGERPPMRSGFLLRPKRFNGFSASRNNRG
jgi:hypothetical protein